MPSADDFTARNIEAFRADHGRLGGPFEGAPVLLLHTFGAKSGTKSATRTLDVHAVELIGAERDEKYAVQAERYPGFAGYQRMTDRIIPVIALTTTEPTTTEEN